MTARTTYANLAATAALLISLTGGVAVAAGQLAPKSVGTKHLKKNAVTTAKVKNGSLLAADFKAGELEAGPAGPPGAPASAFIGYQQIGLSVAASSCGVMQVSAPGLKVGETAVFAPQYNSFNPMPPGIVITPGLATEAGVLPINVCNHNASILNPTGVTFGLWRLAGQS